jgi:hypothetical protein
MKSLILNSLKTKRAYLLLISIIFILSFRFFSSMFYPILNSDNAVTILMIYYFKLPQDLYFWDQDRMGSLIPLIGQIPFKIFKLSPVVSESIIHYLILLLGFLSFASFLNSRYLKIIFAFIWFFPPTRLIDVIQLYSGVEYSLIAMSCYLIVFQNKLKGKNILLFRHLILFITTILLIASIWVSDMALITVFLFLTVNLFFYLKANKITYSIFKKIELYYVLIGTLIGFLFIHYAKSNASHRINYTAFSDFLTIKKSCEIFIGTLFDLFKFNANEPLGSVYLYLVIAVFIFVAIFIRQIKINESQKKWMVFFLLDASILFIVVLASHWTYLNGVPRRYFTCSYISFSMFFLILMDHIKNTNPHFKFIYPMLLFTVLIGGIGTIINIKCVWPKTMTPRVEVVGEFKKLGKIGIISEYWNSYITSCPNPDIIKATPHDTSWAVKNYTIVDEVFKQENIYVIKDMWLKQFPDTMNEFGRVLIKDGEEFHIGDCYVCKYKKIK